MTKKLRCFQGGLVGGLNALSMFGSTTDAAVTNAIFKHLAVISYQCFFRFLNSG